MLKKSTLIRINRGFTLIEIMVALSIIGILIAMSYPMFTSSMVNNRLYSEATQTNSILSLARNEAIRRNDFVTVCPTNNGTSCLATNDFQTGTIIFSNPNNVGLNTSSQIIRVFDKWIQVDKGKITTGNLITFSAEGRVNLSNTILVCKPTYNSFSINLNASGLIQLVKNIGDGGC